MHSLFMQKLDSVAMVIHVSFCTIVAIIRLDGNWKKNGRKQCGTRHVLAARIQTSMP